MSLLELVEVSVHYGGVKAVSEVCMNVKPGEVAGLIGPNGAGKSTLIDAITGFVSYSGAVHLDSTSLDEMLPHERTRAGVARTFQSAEVFSQLSVRDNVRVARERPSLGGLLLDCIMPARRGSDAQVGRVLEIVGLAEMADLRPVELSYGQRRLLAVAQALATDAKVLLLDEPAAGLDRAESELMQEQLKLLASHGPGILLVEHDMRLVFGVCETVWVLAAGRILASGTPAEVRSNTEVVAAYLGDRGAENRYSESLV